MMSKFKTFLFVSMILIAASSSVFAANVKNYFTSPGTGTDNVLVIGGNMTAIAGSTVTFAGKVTAGSISVTTLTYVYDVLTSTYITVTGTSTFGGLMQTAAITSSGLLTASSGSFAGTVYSTGAITSGGALAGTTLDTGQGANDLYDMDQNVLTTSVVTFATGTVTNAFKAKSLAPSGEYTDVQLRALVANWVGEMVLNGSLTPKEIYVSTGTSAGQWAAIKDYTTAP